MRDYNQLPYAVKQAAYTTAANERTKSAKLIAASNFVKIGLAAMLALTNLPDRLRSGISATGEALGASLAQIVPLQNNANITPLRPPSKNNKPDSPTLGLS